LINSYQLDGKKIEDGFFPMFPFNEYVNYLKFIEFQKIDRYPKARKKDTKAKGVFKYVYKEIKISLFA
jgi:hypothetical protein